MSRSLSDIVRDAFDPDTVWEKLASPVRAERALAVEHLKPALRRPEYRRPLVELLTRGAPLAPQFLDALSLIPAVGELPVYEPLRQCLDSREPGIRRPAARVLARCFSARCADLRPWFAHDDVRYESCFSGAPAVAEALWSWFRAHGRAPDVAFGLLLTPDLLCRLATADAAAADLAERFGYAEGLKFRAVEPGLARGLWCVPPGAEPTDWDDVQRRFDQVERALLGLLLKGSDPPNADLDVAAPVDVAALCAAVRSLDDQQLHAKKFENRLRPRALENIRPALCKHAPLAYCRKILIEQPQRAAINAGVRPQDLGRWLLEHAAALVTYDADLRAERMLYWKARWTDASAGSPPSAWAVRISDVAEAPELKHRILTPGQWSRTRRYLDAPSPGALAVARLLQVVEREDLVEPLFAAERSAAAVMPPLGTELQLMFSPEREHASLAWKQTLRALGIPSPRRPEYRAMVEVALPPSRSDVPQILAPLLLERLGLFAERGDVALHLSFSGDLGDVRALLFAQLFINPPRLRPGPVRLARLLSKGFVCRNTDAVPLDGVTHGGIRTELRACRFGCLGPGHDPLLQRHFIDDVRETSLLVAAQTSPAPESRQVWSEFCGQISDAAARLPPVFTQLLDSDWYACTAEPRDEAFAAQLPIAQAWLAVREWVQANAAGDELRERFRDIRRTYARRAAERLVLPDLAAWDAWLRR